MENSQRRSCQQRIQDCAHDAAYEVDPVALETSASFHKYPLTTVTFWPPLAPIISMEDDETVDTLFDLCSIN